jgi:hypothetical protein
MNLPQFKIGDRVRIRNRRNLPIARIVRIIHGRPGGVVLDRLIGGFAMWNTTQLTKVDK